MLSIRLEQMNVWATRERERFVVEASTRLRELFSEETKTLGPEPLPDWVRRKLEHAKEYGIVREMEVQRFLELLLHLGEDPSTAGHLAWVWTLLENLKRSPQLRLDAIYSELLVRNPC